MKWQIPGENAGQIVVVEYTAAARGVYQRVTDRSDRSVRYYRADWDDFPPDFEGDFQTRPPSPEGGWIACGEPHDDDD